MRLSVGTTAGDVARVLEVEARGLRDWSKPTREGPSYWDRSHRVFVESRRRMYATQNASEGAMWPQYVDTPERDHYIYAKSAIAGIPLDRIAGTVLQWPPYNRLRNSLTVASHPDHVWRTSPEEAEAGTRTPWAYANHTGTGRAPRHLGGHQTPRRPLLDSGPQTIEAYTRAAVDYISERIEDTVERVTAAEALAMVRARGVA